MSFPEVGVTEGGSGLGRAVNTGWQEFCVGLGSLKSLLDFQLERCMS